MNAIRKLGGMPECNSFTPGTKVLLADRSHKPIEQVKIGDQVQATDPDTGESSPQAVVGTIIGQGEKHLVEITVDTDGVTGEVTGTVTATDGHPFWLPEQQAWTRADQLEVGAMLQTAAGTWVQVAALRKWTAQERVYNLTVAKDHTYYVLAGAKAVLVHNCNTTVYRLQTDHPDSQRLSVDSDGGVSINGDGMLHLNMSGNIAHTEQFRGSGGQLVAFDVPTSYVDQVRSAAISQRRPSGMSRRQWNIFSSGRPQIDDPGRGPDLYGLPSEMFPGLLEAIIPGSGRVL